MSYNHPSSQQIEQLRLSVERTAFNVCAWLALQMGIRRSRVRTYFIYLSCLTTGSGLIFYFFAAFWLNVRHYMREGRRHIAW
jgi:phage shock protein PspC (stress-responsive transcriptional regulator)